MDPEGVPWRDPNPLVVSAGLSSGSTSSPFVGSADAGRPWYLRRHRVRQVGGEDPAVAAFACSECRLLGGRIDWAEVWDGWQLRELGSLPRLVSLNASVAAYLAGGWTGAVTRRGTDAPDKGKGFVTRRGTHPVATCNVDGQVHQLTAVCPHLKGIVRWNDAEQSWDCPLHGSRFSADGSLLEGPATRGLRALKPEASGQHGPA